jgi:hypothetical protein
MIKGLIDCQTIKTVPIGSVAYIYVFDLQNKEVNFFFYLF